MKHLSLFFFSLMLGQFVLYAQQISPPHFSHARGFCDSAFVLVLSHDTAGSRIYYTLDGSAPTAENGNLYQQPLHIQGSSVVRARAYLDTLPSRVETHSYIFLRQVIQQPAELPGWPNPVYATDFRGNSARLDYEMDPAITQDSAYSADLLKGLQDLPTVCLSMKQDEFWEMNDGWREMPVSVEILYPQAPQAHEQADAGIEGVSHRHLKRSYRLEFKAQYGPTKLRSEVMRRTAPLNAASVSNKFDQLVLRAGTQRSWARNWIPNGAAFIRDQWYRDSQIQMSGSSTHGTFVHLYLNAVYFGLYNLAERPNKGFMEEYFGGRDEEYFVVNHNGVISGDSSRWHYLRSVLLQADLRDSATYAEFRQYVDVPQFIDYLLLTWSTGMVDWPNNNYYISHRMGPNPEPMRFFAWDGEQCWDEEMGAHEGAWVAKAFRRHKSGGPPIAAIFNAVKHNADFMMEFADRAYSHCFGPQGALTDSAQQARWRSLALFIADAVVAESARWGDALQDGTTRSRDTHWWPEVNRVLQVMQGNAAQLIDSLKKHGYYPSLQPPVPAVEGGLVDPHFPLQIINPNDTGTIYYRLDGGDPRLPGGAVSPQARPYLEPLLLSHPIELAARVKNGAEWSAIYRTSFSINAPITGLYINEWLAGNTADTTDESGSHADWIELYNADTASINLAGLYLSDDLNNPRASQIPTGFDSLTTIPPGGHLLLWADNDPQQGPLHLNFRLNSGGELIGLFQPLGNQLHLVDLLTFGPQLDNVSQGRLPDGGDSIVAFAHPTPAAPNRPETLNDTLRPYRLYINEFMAINQNDTTDESGSHADWIELYNADTLAVDIGGWYLTDKAENPTLWRIPDTAAAETTIPPGGFLLLWADKTPGQGVRHLNFRLSGGGEFIGLVRRLGTQAYFVDSLHFGPQTADVSYGRYPDAGSLWQLFELSTPGSSNLGDSLPPPDCAGVPGGTALLDSCGQCLQPASPDFNACLQPDTLLFVVGQLPLGLGDVRLKQFMTDLGYELDIVLDEQAQSSHAHNRAAIVISSTVLSGRLRNTFTHTAVPLLCWEPYLYDDLLMTGSLPGKHYGHSGVERRLELADSTHALAARMQGSTDVFSSGRRMAWGQPAASALRIAHLPGQPGKWTIFGYEAGEEMLQGLRAPARRLGFFLNDYAALYWTPQGMQLFEAALCWLTACSQPGAFVHHHAFDVPAAGVLPGRLLVFPNPADEVLRIESQLAAKRPAVLLLKDYTGRLVQRIEAEGEVTGYFSTHIDTGSLAEGLYLLQLLQDGQVHTEKVWVRH